MNGSVNLEGRYKICIKFRAGSNVINSHPLAVNSSAFYPIIKDYRESTHTFYTILYCIFRLQVKKNQDETSLLLTELKEHIAELEAAIQRCTCVSIV